MLTTKDKPLYIVSVYAPNISKSREEKIFYEQLHQLIEGIPLQDDVIVLDDFNTRVGNDTIAKIKQRM